MSGGSATALLSPNALRVLEARYLRRDAARRVIETPVTADASLQDFLEDSLTENPNDLLMNRDLAEQVERALSALSPREKEILQLRFGIGRDGEHTLEEIGARFAVTRERIRQIEAQALRKLRSSWRTQTLKAFVEAS